MDAFDIDAELQPLTLACEREAREEEEALHLAAGMACCDAGDEEDV